MPPRGAAAKQSKRVYNTNKAQESLQFSTLRLPSSNAVSNQKVDVDAMYAELEGRVSSPPTTRRSGLDDSSGATPTNQAAAFSFDPIPSDPMFVVVEKSTYWPPPSLEELQATTGVPVAGVDGFDTYDRREDDQKAKKEHVKAAKGELVHPRGKPRKNTIVKLATDSDEDQEEAGSEGSR